MKTIVSFLWAALLLSLIAPSLPAYAQTADSIRWGTKTLVRNVAPDSSGRYGSQYARMLQLKDGNWLMGYTISSGKRYDKDRPYGPASTGGLELEVSQSKDGGKTWGHFAGLP